MNFVYNEIMKNLKPIKPLTDLQFQFYLEFIRDGHCINSWLRALTALNRPPCSKSNANSRAYQTKQLPAFKILMEKHNEAKQSRAEISTEWVVGKLIDNVEKSMQDTPVLDRQGNEVGQYVYQGAVANGALALLGKHTGGFDDRSKVDVELGDKLMGLLSSLKPVDRVTADDSHLLDGDIKLLNPSEEATTDGGKP